MKCPLIFIWMFLKIIWCSKRNPTSRFQGQQKLQFQLKINQAEKHSNSAPSQVVIPQVKKLTEVKPEQPEFKHIGGGAKTESFEDVSNSLLSTGLFGKLTSREDPDLDFGGHFKYDLHPEEKLASSYFGKLNSVKHRMDRVIMKCINLVRMDHYILFMMGIYVSRHHCKRSCYR